MTDIQVRSSYKKVSDLPEEQKYYMLELRNGYKFYITGKHKQQILNTPKTFFELNNGDVINKADISCILLDKKLTKEKWQLAQNLLTK